MDQRTFLSLIHARAVRDRLVAFANDDVRRLGSDSPAIIERICTARDGYRADLAYLQKRAFERWDGDGFPDWAYLSDLGDAIEYIAAAEREGVAAAIAARPYPR